VWIINKSKSKRKKSVSSVVEAREREWLRVGCRRKKGRDEEQ